MADTTPRLREATVKDLDIIILLLSSHGLPTDDLAGKAASLFVLEVDGRIIGSGGVEVFGDAGLLRSVAVVEPLRGEGFGATICREIVGRMRARGVRELFLLTTTAPGFFGALGFTRIDRNDAPAEIRGTTEFSGVCPISAVCMRMGL